MANLFQLGDTGSADAFMTALNTLRTQGQTILDQCAAQRSDTLVEFQQRMNALNGRRQRANRVASPDLAVSFPVCDLLSIDQTLTTATVRGDSQAVTLKERTVASQATVLTKNFSTNDGTAEPISTDGTLYRVHVTDGGTPTGTFGMRLTNPLTLTVLTFDLAAMPSTPTITVTASIDGVTYVPATQTQLNGNRLTAWFSAMEMLYVQLSITPSHPDTLGGTSFTFGLVAFNGTTTEFQLVSELVTKPISFAPSSTQLTLVAQNDPNLTYFLSFNGGEYVEYAPGAEIPIPGTAAVNASAVAMNGSGVLAHNWPANAYVDALEISLDGDTSTIIVAPGLNPADTNIARIVNRYMAINGAVMTYIRPNLAADAGKTFSFSYVTGPASVSVQLKVQLSTTDRALTPTFTGASLQEI